MSENMIVISNIITSLDDSQNAPIDKALKLSGIKTDNVIDSFVIKTSVDARHSKFPQLVSSVGLETNIDEAAYVKRIKNKNINLRQKTINDIKISKGNIPLLSSPIIVGFGPAGMFAGLILAQNGYKPIIIERGSDVDKRVNDVKTFWETGKLNINSNVQFGEGGAGTFSDGKLTTRINDPLCEYVINQFVKFGAPSEILKKAKPHIGTDYLRTVVKEIKTEITRLGGTVIDECELKNISVNNGKIIGIETSKGDFPCSVLILAIGHSARDTFNMLLKKNIAVETKPFSVGVRIEHLQKDIDFGLYGKYCTHPLLPKGEYQLSLRTNNRAVYTFCMCPGGVVVPASSEDDGIVVNGMSEYARDKTNANSALVVSVSGEDFNYNPFKAIEFQHNIEHSAFISGGKNYKAPIQTAGKFLNGKFGAEIGRIIPSYALRTNDADFEKIFPAEICKMLKLGITDFGKKIKGFDASDAVLTGVESRTSSPIRIIRGENRQSVSLAGLYPCGEGAGYAGGIMSAAVDGIKTAISIIETYCYK